MVRARPTWKARSLILHHHERWDGKGYPDGLVGEDIPIRAGCWPWPTPSTTFDRPYRARPHREDLRRSQSGRQFDPKGGGLPALLERRSPAHPRERPRTRISRSQAHVTSSNPENHIRSIPGPSGGGLYASKSLHERDDGYSASVETHDRSCRWFLIELGRGFDRANQVHMTMHDKFYYQKHDQGATGWRR
jgi:hypothetical protein